VDFAVVDVQDGREALRIGTSGRRRCLRRRPRWPIGPYLVDHAFVPTGWLARVSRFEIGSPDLWLELSDHMPLVLDLVD
jgi:hypothetical protein